MSVPAVVVGIDINGLGVVRSLARGRVPIVAVDVNPRPAAMRTRHGRKVAFRSLEGEALVEDLLALRQRFDHDPVLFLTQEKTVLTVARHRERLLRVYRLALAPDDCLLPLMDKTSFQSIAERHGFAIPRAIGLHSEDDLAQAESLVFPCVLKPDVKDAEYGKRFAKAYKVADIDELRRRYREIRPTLADLIAQEWIEGGDDSIYFCLQYRSRQGERVASFVGRKLRSWPPRIGGTASCLPAPEHAAELERVTDAFFTAVGFFGMGSMEFKRDARSGRFLMIEPTVGRTDFQEEVATVNGVNIPLAAYRHELGLPRAEAVPPARPAVWKVADIDRWSAELQPACGAAVPAGARVREAYWRVDDPGPWCQVTAERCWDALRKIGRRRH